MKLFPRVISVGLGLFFPVALCTAVLGFEKAPAASSPDAVEKTSQKTPSLSGKVVETMDSGGYTYINLERDGEKVWVAVPKMKVKVGQEIALNPGGVMENFKSATLKRNFEMIIFSSGPVTQDENKAGKPAEKKSMGSSPAAATQEATKVEKAAGPDAYTIGELFKGRDTLDKKNVVVRGKVVKVSSGIMGKNWIHLQDGSGDAKEKSHDIVVTSQDLPAVGDVVTASGTLYKDKDFGAGYKFGVIIENAKVSK